MSHEEMIREYTKCYKNMLSPSTEKRMDELEALVEADGLYFRMTNETQWMMPHYLGDPHFVLAQIN